MVTYFELLCTHSKMLWVATLLNVFYFNSVDSRGRIIFSIPKNQAHHLFPSPGCLVAEEHRAGGVEAPLARSQPCLGWLDSAMFALGSHCYRRVAWKQGVLRGSLKRARVLKRKLTTKPPMSTPKTTDVSKEMEHSG